MRATSCGSGVGQEPMPGGLDVCYGLEVDRRNGRTESYGFKSKLGASAASETILLQADGLS